ncbi:MAG: hypothetical protein TREMPRED_001405 [Tremellales sp. Tagirdzhanova-0007]|nr:MAG: hypothetical protein TREMPRED_001405 [Tremellales sp. Tagirdzhanova-0007]
MPVLSAAIAPEAQHLTVPGSRIAFRASVQHDCCGHQCQTTGTRRIMQERHETIIEQSVLEHREDHHFVINTHGMHNAHLVRAALEPQLVRPHALHADRVAFHGARAIVMMKQQESKREQAKAKRAYTQQRKDALGAAAAAKG